MDQCHSKNNSGVRKIAIRQTSLVSVATCYPADVCRVRDNLSLIKLLWCQWQHVTQQTSVV